MPRADRLFHIVQHLRARRLTTAAQLAEWLDVSERTIYRDVNDLSASGVPVRGEAGVGYQLDRSYNLLPIMFTPDEIESAVFGLRMVESFAGPGMIPHVRSALAKIALALPQERRDEIENTKLFAPNIAADTKAWTWIGPLRQAITRRLKVTFDYVNESNAASTRTIRPLGLYFWGKVWTLVAWCDMRNDFRHFRLDRISNLALTTAHFHDEQDKSLDRFLELIKDRRTY